MEEENAVRFQYAQLSVSCGVCRLPLPVRKEAAHKMFGVCANMSALHVMQ
jgi:hypothetical protein